MPSRISGACNACRAKKQKVRNLYAAYYGLTTSQCSGDRSGCEQCRVAEQACTWPAQRKRHAFPPPMRISSELIGFLQWTGEGLHRRTRASSTGDRESPASDPSSSTRRLSGSHHRRLQRVSKPNHDYPSASNAEQQDQCRVLGAVPT
jgi:hypothetical protein